MAASLIGQSLGKYSITDLIGQGGMATVYKGYQADIDRYVAVKVLPPHPGLDASFYKRFQLEAQLIARLQHPHIVPLYDYGEENGVLYLVQAYISGGALHRRINGKPQPLGDIERILNQIASALDYAHRQNVVHRDIKPDNILIDSEGNALLTDFGIARLVEDVARFTMTGKLIGTPKYMSPEQAQGNDVQAASDIYSLGVVVFEMLTGEGPYSTDGNPLSVIMKHLRDPIPVLSERVSGLPFGLDAVMQRVLAKDPADRYPTATEFARDFSRALRTQEGAFPSGTVNLSFTAQPSTQSATAPSSTAPGVTTGTSTSPTAIFMSQPGVNIIVLISSFASIVLLVVVVLLLINRPNLGFGTLLTETPTGAAPAVIARTEIPTFGLLSYTTAETLGDAVNLRVEGLTPPAQGKRYVAWLEGEADSAPLKLGELRLDALGNGQLSYTDADARVLPTLYHTVRITEEETAGDAPTGDTRYSGSVPVEVTQGLRAILVESEQRLGGASDDDEYGSDSAGSARSLLGSALLEAGVALQHSGLAAGATNVGGLHLHSEHTLNVLLGTKDDYDGDGKGQNPGRGVGVAHFLDLIEADLNAAASMPNASRSLQTQIELIRVCTQNARDRLTEAAELERALLNADDVAAAAPQAAASTEKITAMIDGVDLNQNGQIEPFEGECGLKQIAPFGILVGNIDIVAGTGAVD